MTLSVSANEEVLGIPYARFEKGDRAGNRVNNRD